MEKRRIDREERKTLVQSWRHGIGTRSAVTTCGDRKSPWETTEAEIAAAVAPGKALNRAGCGHSTVNIVVVMQTDTS